LIPDVALAFLLTSSFRPHYGPGINYSSDINKYMGYLPGYKRGEYVWLTTFLPTCVTCLEILGA